MNANCENIVKECLNNDQFQKLSPEELQIYTSRRIFDLNLVKCVINVLAKFHSKSLIYEELKSQEIGKSYRLDQDYELNRFSIDFQQPEIIDVISSVLDEDNLSNVVQELELRQSNTSFRRTLCHGDLIPENIMFSSKEIDPKCKLINFKPKQYKPPVCDLLQMIFLNTTEEFRQCHLEELFLFYHSQLSKELKKYYLEIDQALSLEELCRAAHHFSPIIKLQKSLQSSEFREDLKHALTFPILSKEDLYTIIRNKTLTTDYKLLSFSIKPLDQVSGYLGNYHKLQLTILHTSEEDINCFVKTIPKNGSSNSIVRETGCFFKEIFVYDTLVPQMKNLGVDLITHCLPACYFQRSEEVVVFDDLSVAGYRSLPAQITYGLTLLRLSLQKLAQFHASSIIFEEKMTQKMGRKYRLGEEYSSKLKEIFFSKESHSGALVMQTGIKSVPDVIDLFPELKTDTNLKNFTKAWPQLQEIYYDGVKASVSHRNVLSHGDLWTNNIMVKLDGDTPMDCLFVDFQCIRYCPPAHDFLCVLYLTTDRATRMEHQEECKLIYFRELAKALECFGYKIEDFYSFEKFVESVADIEKQIVLQAISYKMFTTVSSEDISSFLTSDEVSDYVFFKNRKEYLKNISEKSVIVKRYLRECILDLFDLCAKIASS